MNLWSCINCWNKGGTPRMCDKCHKEVGCSNCTGICYSCHPELIPKPNPTKPISKEDELSGVININQMYKKANEIFDRMKKYNKLTN